MIIFFSLISLTLTSQLTGPLVEVEADPEAEATGMGEDRGERGLQSITTANISSHLPRLSLGFHWLDGLDNGLERH